ncbi:hypothetical protein [uncultured Clostridium sp.]|uniref:hypothetical protein n=1 Tax=uncultured Clostridium sp. TaxID=59620 RepID=UPI0026F3AF8A|nr:hypothetical protein [uncultured Clostridium sp.]
MRLKHLESYKKFLPEYTHTHKKVCLMGADNIDACIVRTPRSVYRLVQSSIFHDSTHIIQIHTYNNKPVVAKEISWNEVVKIHLKKEGIHSLITIETYKEEIKLKINGLKNYSILKDFITQAEVYFKLNLI